MGEAITKNIDACLFDTVESILSQRLADRVPEGRLVPAAVAMVLRQGDAGPEMLFIERAKCHGDPWSGDLGFPGGKVEASDADPCSAARREALEEIGLDLAGARYLGRLAEITGATLPVRVTCFVFALFETPDFVLNGEVQDAFWVSLADLRDLSRHTLTPIPVKGEMRHFPAVLMPVSGKPPLWGLTYRLVQRFFELLADAVATDSPCRHVAG
jgi:8-oxo-dGTP pyrophosphatase MutT (NUDIX family)